jgi:hypothetical protein
MTRIPEHLRTRLERAADKAGRSMNAEIIFRLERSFDREEVVKTAVDVVEQVLKTSYGPGWGAFLNEMDKAGILTLTPEAKQSMRDLYGVAIDSVGNAKSRRQK